MRGFEWALDGHDPPSSLSEETILEEQSKNFSNFNVHEKIFRMEGMKWYISASAGSQIYVVLNNGHWIFEIQRTK